MIFRQLFESISSTYTYLLGCEDTGQAILVDPVLPTWQRDLGLIHELGLTLAYTVETHVHADHITSALKLREQAGSRIAGPALDRLPCTDLGLEDGTPLAAGSIVLEPLHTPGHTDNHFAYLCDGRVLTGDALLIDGCGRTDFQNGDAGALYDSIQHRLFVLAPDTLVYPGHDYQGRRVSTIAQEKTRNPRLAGKSRDEFCALMATLALPYPKFIDYAVPGNRQCGVCPSHVPEQLEQYCRDIGESRQG